MKLRVDPNTKVDMDQFRALLRSFGLTRLRWSIMIPAMPTPVIKDCETHGIPVKNSPQVDRFSRDFDANGGGGSFFFCELLIR